MLKPQGLIAAVCVLGVLGGYAWWAGKHPAPDASAKASATAPKILSIAADQVQSIRIARRGAPPVVVAKTGDQWQITAPKPYPADPDAVSDFTSAVSPLNSDRLIDEHPQSLATFGLDAPASEVDITTKDGKTRQILFGADTVTNSGAFVKVDGDPRVYTVASATKKQFDKSIDDFRDKRMMTLNADKITSVVVSPAKGSPFEFRKDSGGGWQITKPKTMRADGSAVDDMVGKLKDTVMDLTEYPTEANFATYDKIGSATLTDDKGPQTLEIRRMKDGTYYGKSSAVPGIYKIAFAVGQAIDNKTVEDFRNKKLFDFGFTDPSKVDLGGKLYEKTGDKWFSGSVQIDSGSIQNVVDKLRDLAAAKFSDKISGAAVLTVSVTWGDKSKVDKVTVNKSGDDYIGVRDGDATAYVLDGNAFADLQQAIAAIKPAVAAKADTKK